jgi:ppGpp synthetase/RelA/SpoT-type nucleotidyltranferase
MRDDIKLEEWYNKNKSLYQSLLTEAESIVKELLDGENVNYFRIENRVKEFQSWRDKLLQQKYVSPEEVLDLAGLRIIGRTLGDIRRIETVAIIMVLALAIY